MAVLVFVAYYYHIQVKSVKGFLYFLNFNVCILQSNRDMNDFLLTDSESAYLTEIVLICELNFLFLSNIFSARISELLDRRFFGANL